jgi:hypothetical protein
VIDVAFLNQNFIHLVPVRTRPTQQAHACQAQHQLDPFSLCHYFPSDINHSLCCSLFQFSRYRQKRRFLIGTVTVPVCNIMGRDMRSVCHTVMLSYNPNDDLAHLFKYSASNSSLKENSFICTITTDLIKKNKKTAIETSDKEPRRIQQ